MNRKADIEEGVAAALPSDDQSPSGVPSPEESQISAAPLNRELSGKLAGKSLPKQVLILAIWPFLEQFLNFLVGFVDTYLAGHLSVAATNAIAVAAYIGWLMGIILMSVGVGASAVIARAIGGKHKRVANAALGQAMNMSVMLGFLAGGMIFLLAPWLAGFMELKGEALEICITYLRIFAVAGPASAILFVGTACLRAAGDTRSPFVVLTIVNVVNIIVSALLVYGPEPIGGHGATGIAIGTSVAWLVGAIVTLTVLIGGWGGIRLRLIRLRPHWHTMKRIIRVASANLVESLGMWIGNFAVVKMVGIVGITHTAALGAHLIGVRLEAISYLPCMALGTAAATLTGQYLGLGDVARAKRAARLCWTYGAIVMGLMGILFWFIPEQFVRMVTNEPELIKAAPDLLRICAPIQVFFATAIVLSHAMRGAGDTRTAMHLTYFSTWCIRIPLAYVFSIVLGWGLNGVWFALCGELVLRGILFGGRFLHGGWTKIEV